MPEQVAEPGQLRPRFIADLEARGGRVDFGDVAGGNPQPFDRQPCPRVVVPRGFVVGQEITDLVEHLDQLVDQKRPVHNSWASTAPGTSSVMTWT